MPTEPLTGSRYPAAGASPNVPQDIQNAVSDLADNTWAGPFTTTTTRNAAYAAWVAAGNTMRNGLTCTVAGVPQVYFGGTWHGVISSAYRDVTVDSAAKTATADILSIVIPDPGFPYQVYLSGSALINVDTGVTVAAQLRANSTTILQGITLSAGTQQLATVSPAMTDVLTGGTTVALTISKFSGAVGSGFSATATPNVYTQLSAQVNPA